MNTPSHPFNIEYLKRTLTAQLSPQPGHDKPRSSWDADELVDEKPQTDTIQVLLVRSNELPELVTIGNDLEPMQGLIGGVITTFDTGVEGTIGVAHDEAVLLQMPPNRYIPSTGALIFGPLFIAGDGSNLHSLSETQLENALDAFVPPLTAQQVQTALRGSEETVDDPIDWIEIGLREALDE